MELISKDAVIDLINNPLLYLSFGGMNKGDLLKGIEELPVIAEMKFTKDSSGRDHMLVRWLMRGKE